MEVLQPAGVSELLLESENGYLPWFSLDCLNISASGNPLGCSGLREGPPARDPEAAAAGLGEGKKRGQPVLRQHSGAAHPQRGSGDAG